MSNIFGAIYGEAYDRLYRDKDYETESNTVDRLLRSHAIPGRTLVDLGCGTGTHALALARRGYAVTGVDRSPAMLEIARRKASAATLASPPEFVEGDARSVTLGRTFDAALMMFAVLGYMHTNADLAAALDTIRRHLVPGGLFLFDVWYGPAVLSDPPGDRVRDIRDGDTRLVRTTSTALDGLRHTCTVRFGLLRLEGGRVAAETDETHTMRFFFPQELSIVLDRAGLDLVDLRSFPDGEREPDLRTWSVLGVARARR